MTFGLGAGLSLALPGTQCAKGGFVGALDAYKSGLTEAWSINRRLFAGYSGPLLSVMRSSDSSVKDIGTIDSGDLDVASILSFCGSGDGSVRTIYGQLRGNHLEQSDSMYQPKIAVGGVLQTSGGLPATSLVNQWMSTASNCGITGANERGIGCVAEVNSRSFVALAGEGELDKAFGIDVGDSVSYFFFWSHDVTTTAIQGRHVLGFSYKAGTATAIKDGMSIGTLGLAANTTNSPISIGARFSPSYSSAFSDFLFNELIQYSDTSVMSAVSVNQKAYFGTP